MADHFIDHDETQVYGDYAWRMMARFLLPALPAITAIVEYAREELKLATERTGAQVARARTASAGVRAGKKSKAPLKHQALRAAGRFSRHLDTHDANLIDRRTYFTDDGTAGGIGTSAPRVLLAMAHLARVLDQPDCPVREREYWQAEFARLAEALSQVVDHSEQAHADRIAATPEVRQSLTAWRTVYGACKSISEGILRLQGRLHLLPVIFYDLAVPSGTKLTAAPPEPVVPPEPVEPEDRDDEDEPT